MRATWENDSLRIRTRSLPPISLHWSAALGALIFGRGTVGGFIGFVTLVLIHEIGHAVLVRARRLHAHEIVVHAFGGVCRYEGGWGTPFDHAIIAWGGVAAQAILLVVAFVAARTLEPGPGIVSDLAYVLVVPNALMIVLNLLPIPRLDGRLAWQLPKMLRERGHRQRLERTHDKLRRELEASRRRRLH